MKLEAKNNIEFQNTHSQRRISLLMVFITLLYWSGKHLIELKWNSGFRKGEFSDDFC